MMALRKEQVMRKNYEDLYQSLQRNLASVKEEEGLCWIELCFQQAVVHWELLKQRVLNDGFNSEEEEIHFFKKTKHLFTAEIEYYSLRYHAFLFDPGPDEKERMLFYHREAGRLDQYIQKYSDFYYYLKSGCTEKDPIYFLKKNLWRQPPELVKCGHHDYPLTTSHEYLVSVFTALERYDVFIKELVKKYSAV